MKGPVWGVPGTVQSLEARCFFSELWSGPEAKKSWYSRVPRRVWGYGLDFSESVPHVRPLATAPMTVSVGGNSGDENEDAALWI